VGRQGPRRVCVDSQLLKGIFEHAGDESAEKGAGQLKAGVGVGLYQPHLEVFVDHVIKSKDLKGEIFFVRVDLGIDGPEHISCYFLNIHILTFISG
jgi:hypothetical protein